MCTCVCVCMGEYIHMCVPKRVLVMDMNLICQDEELLNPKE